MGVPSTVLSLLREVSVSLSLTNGPEIMGPECEGTEKTILSKIKLAQVKLWLLGNYLAVFSQRLGENIPSRSCKDSMVACWNLAFFPLNRRRMRSTLSTLSLIASTKLIAFLKSRPSESSVPGVSAR